MPERWGRPAGAPAELRPDGAAGPEPTGRRGAADDAMPARYGPGARRGRPRTNLWKTGAGDRLAGRPDARQGSMIVWKSYGSRRNPIRSYNATAWVLKSFTYSDRFGCRPNARWQHAAMARVPTPRPRSSGGT